MSVIRDLTYGEAGGHTLQLDLHVPEERGEGALPTIVWVHGGAWRGGSRDDPTALPILAYGYAVACISYRLSHQARFPAQLHDCKAAVRWLRANAGRHGLDPDRFAAWGASAGGHLVALLGTTGGARELEGETNDIAESSRVQAVIDWFGPTDLLRLNEPGVQLDHDAPDSPGSELIGGPVQENREKATRANPIPYITPDAPPFLIQHGTDDPTVPFSQSVLLYEALRAAGVEAALQPVPNTAHGGGGFETPEVWDPVVAFLGRHLT